jgi:hypothetical protein
VRIFVAGAIGVIGRRLVPRLLTAGHQVTAAARTLAKQAALEGLGAAATFVDLFTPSALRSAVRGHEVVVNLAAHQRVDAINSLGTVDPETGFVTWVGDVPGDSPIHAIAFEQAPSGSVESRMAPPAVPMSVAAASHSGAAAPPAADLRAQCSGTTAVQ